MHNLHFSSSISQQFIEKYSKCFISNITYTKVTLSTGLLNTQTDKATKID